MQLNLLARRPRTWGEIYQKECCYVIQGISTTAESFISTMDLLYFSLDRLLLFRYEF